MSKARRLALLGGDARQETMKRELERMGWRVDAWGLETACAATPQEAVRGADAILLPMPATTDGVRIRTQRQNASLRFPSLLEMLPERSCILGGRLPDSWQQTARERGHYVEDYAESDVLQLYNALPTVEAAICLAMQSLPVTLFSTRVCVIGYGRIASLLAERLVSLGADVTVYARRERDMVHATLRGARGVQIKGEGEGSTLAAIPPDCRVLFNTVPQRILSRPILERLPKGCLLMELASAPGGFDPLLAESLGLCPMLASALPGKHFPESAGRLLAGYLSERLRSLLDEPTDQSERKDRA